MFQCIRPLDLIIMIFALENYDFGNTFLHPNPTCEMIFVRIVWHITVTCTECVVLVCVCVCTCTSTHV